MRVGVIQSNYLPWRGYFDFIDSVDLFIFHDDIQYTKNDWRNRNKIKTANGATWITVPVHYKFTNQIISDTEIDYSQPWNKKQINMLDQWYKRAPHYHIYRDNLKELLEIKYTTISHLNIELIRWCMNILGIETNIILSSSLDLHGTKTERLIDILKKVDATEYLSGPSAKNYLNEDLFIKNKILLKYKYYKYSNYPQIWGDFIDGLSILDLMFNVGGDSMKFLKSELL